MKSLLYASFVLFNLPLAWAEPINRPTLVSRHDVFLTNFDAATPLSVGNGQFAFTVDATGLQTFPEAFVKTTPLGTLADWGWHTDPNPNGWEIETFHFREFADRKGRLVPYADAPHNEQTAETKWLRANPHRLHLGQIGLVLRHADGSLAKTNYLKQISQRLDLWNGEITSRFQFDGEPVVVTTLCSPTSDAIAVQIKSPLLAAHQLAVQIRFPYGTGDITTADWEHPEAHTTTLAQIHPNTAHFGRRLDHDTYVVDAEWSAGATLTNMAPHTFAVLPDARVGELEFTCAFARQINAPLPEFVVTKAATRAHWNQFWQTGGAIDLSGSTDPRWFELERRIVLSQYLTAIQSAASHPPAETGLTYNSWEGKFHLEMHWWHETHFALWNRLALLEKSLGYYQQILPRAEGTAKKQGYAGARWPKMTSPSGAESPSPVGPFLVWQEPHPIFYAELCWRGHRDRATLERYRDIVFGTAAFMASYATWDEVTHHYVLGPVLQCAQEIYPKDNTYNPTFELTYWRWALETAQLWRTRLGLPREPRWDAVLSGLAKPTVAGDKYLFAETTPDCYTNSKWNADHPAVLGALSFVPGPQIDVTTMRNTLDWIWANWNWPDTWGWDYPLMAMTAARVGEPARAVDALLLDTPKNHYGANGHVYQRPGLSIYLPANGGLLYAVALMAAGWDGAPTNPAPGFPQDGRWQVKWENLSPAP